jgi:hypothetical protein
MAMAVPLMNARTREPMLEWMRHAPLKTPVIGWYFFFWQRAVILLLESIPAGYK